jgi:arylamine N-acetyltransferase
MPPEHAFRLVDAHQRVPDLLPPALPGALTRQILAYLGCEPGTPTVRYLNRLMHAYIRRVPWESASRILRRHTTPDTDACPRWPEEFWEQTLSEGTGGTCFENNLAFFSLLSSLGYPGYLTINDMGEQRLCHTAVLISLQGHKHLADVAIPLLCSLPVRAGRITGRSTALYHYTVRPLRPDVYDIERSHHPKRNTYTLLDHPVPLEAYRAATQRDYEPGGYFLDRVIVVKIIDDRLVRFNSAELPYKIEMFGKTSRQETPLERESMARVIAGQFGMQEATIAEALTYVD